VCLAPVVGAQAQPASPAFAECVEAQREIERVYFSHRIGSDRPFEAAVPKSLLEDKVRASLQLSEILDKRWGIRLTTEDAAAELERIVRQTRFPARLEEIFQAMGHDARLMRECFARPVLVQRLARERFASDPFLHAPARQEAGLIHDRLGSGGLDVSADHPRRALIEIVEIKEPGARAGLPRRDAPRRLELTPEPFARQRARLPRRVGEPGPLSDEGDAVVVRAIAAEEPGRLTIATYRVPKRRWDEWWPLARRELAAPAYGRGGDSVLKERGVPAAGGSWRQRPGSMSGVAPSMLSAASPTLGASSTSAAASAGVCVDESWSPLSTTGAPAARESHTAVWTGSEMIVWGGFNGVDLDTGGRYDPLTDSWAPTSTLDAPAGRSFHTAVWSGAEMVVWGGFNESDLDSGGRYDPVSDRWLATSVLDAPTRRDSHSAVWTGVEMIVWGGLKPGLVVTNTGGRYDPTTNSWKSMPTTEAPSARAFQPAIWTGSRMIVWGGNDGSFLGSGGRYDPATDAWSPMAAAPVAGRDSHTAVWNGAEMLVWGGYDGAYLGDGGRYAPLTDTWSLIAGTGAPGPRASHAAVWSGAEMIVWGGSNGAFLDSGGGFDPAAGTWIPTTLAGAPSGRWNFAAVWADGALLVWGGSDGIPLGSGARYEPQVAIDGDLDGYCTTDCDDTNGQVWAAPGEVRDLLFQEDSQTLAWSAPADPGGITAAYDTLRSQAAGDFGAAAICVESDDSSDRSSVDATVPADGGVFFYLVRAENACPAGQGSPGTRSDGAPRSGRTCAAPPP
jgi:hypothetical protein